MQTYWQWIHIFSGVARLAIGFCFQWTKQVFYTIYLFSNFIVFKGNKFLVDLFHAIFLCVCSAVNMLP